jgi:FAD/FMN-containing dehydrogenase
MNTPKAGESAMPGPAAGDSGASDVAARFAALIGTDAVLTDPADLAAYLVEPRDLFHGATPFVLRPRTVEDVAAAVRLANELALPIVPQGGNTGLVGGGVPDGSGREIVLSLARLDRIREVDAEVLP